MAGACRMVSLAAVAGRHNGEEKLVEVAERGRHVFDAADLAGDLGR